MNPTYRTVAREWPRLAVAVSQAVRGTRRYPSEPHEGGVPRADAEAAAVAIYVADDRDGGWTVDQLRQAIERRCESAEAAS